MKLTRIEIENFRCFGKAEFDLMKPGGSEPLDVALIVGGNGSGKSSLLQGLAAFLGFVGQTGKVQYGADPLVVGDVRAGEENTSLRVAWQDTGPGEKAWSLDLLARFFSRTTQLENGTVAAGQWWPQPGQEWANAINWARSVDLTPQPTGLAVAFDIYRLLPPVAVQGPSLSGVPTHRCQRSLTPTVRRGGGLELRFGSLKQWIVNLDHWRARAKADRGEESPLWDTLHHALDTLLAPFKFDRVDDKYEVWFTSPTGRVPLAAFSDGFRSVFVIVAEMLFRLSLACPNGEDILRQEAVCMIDEIDAHLHPRWQETVIPGLRELFPNVQLIATTHSQMVVSTVEPHNVFRLETEGES